MFVNETTEYEMSVDKMSKWNLVNLAKTRLLARAKNNNTGQHI